MRGYRITLIAAASLAAGLLLAGGSALGGAPPATETWVVSGGSLGGGTVKSIAVSGDTAYLGGNFSYLGPPTGSAALFDTSSAAATNTWSITGSVYAVAPDGSNGWFVGGDFASVGPTHYGNLVHVLADGSLDPNWRSGTDGPIFALVVTASIVYAGGAFSQAHDGDSTEQRTSLAAFDKTTRQVTVSPAVTHSNTAVTPFVWTMATSGSPSNTNLYLGGRFTHVGGQARSNLAAVTTAGAVAFWNPSANGTVRALASDGVDVMYAGGEFTEVSGGLSRSRLAAFDETSGAPENWNPGPTQSVAPVAPSVNALAVSGLGAGATIYVGGYFSSIGSPLATRHAIAALDAANGAVVAGFNPDIRSPQSVNRIVVSGTGPSATVYAGGFFQSLGPSLSVSRDNVVGLTASNGAATSFHPVVGGAVYGLALSGSKLAVGGQFRSAGLGSVSDPFPSPVRRNNLGAIDLTTGRPTSWAPYADNTVTTVAVSGSVLYAGGRFEFAADDGAGTNGEPRACLAAFDAATAVLFEWDPGLDPTPPNTPCVNTIAISGSTVYVGGHFDKLFDLNPADPGPGLVTRNGIAAFEDALTGAGFGYVKRDWDPNANSPVNAIAVSGSTVYAGGDFTSIGGLARNHLAALDAASGGADTDWHPDLNNSVEALAVTSSTVYAGGTFTHVNVNNGNVARSGAGAFGTGGVGELGALAATATAWDPNLERLDGSGNLEPGTVNAIATSGSVVYLGGDFDSVGDGSVEEGAAVAVTASSGAAISSWQPEPNDTVDAIALAQTGVLVGGAFTAVGYPRPRAEFEAVEANAKARGGFAAFLGVPEPPGNVTAGAGNGSATVSFTASPFTGGAAVTYTVTSSPGNITASGSGTTIPITGLTNGQQYNFTVTATNSVGVSQPSAPSNAVTPSTGTTLPGAPTNVSAVGGNGQATVTFDPPASNGGSAITLYTVTSSPGSIVATDTTSPIVVDGLTNGTSYTFTVTATNGAGVGPPSAASNAVTPRTVPGAPDNVAAVPGSNQATVSFDAPLDGGSAITLYTVTSSPGNLTASESDTSIVVTGLTNGVSYTFTVTATNVAGTGPASSPSNAVVPGSVPTAPGAPTGVTASPGNTRAVVSFLPPAFDGGTAITSYTVTASPGGQTATGPNSPLVVEGLTNGTSYTFTVKATNGAGTGPPSSPSNAVVPVVPDRPDAVPDLPSAQPRPGVPDVPPQTNPRKPAPPV